jgi:hypothetical protein
LLAELLTLLPLETLPTPSASVPGSEVYPRSSQGFAAYVLGGFFALGLLMLAMFLLSLKPKRVDPDWRDKPG